MNFRSTLQLQKREQNSLFQLLIIQFQYTLISMNKLYSIAFRRLLKSVSATEINSANIQSVLDANNIKQTGSYILYRLPRHELKTFVKNPCPVQNVQTEQNKQMITSSKSLRAHYSIIQQKVCEKCPFKDTCQQSAKPGKQSINTVSDLLLYMSGMDQKANLNQELKWRVWASGYKISDSFAATLEDLKQGGTETLDYEKIRIQNVHQLQEPENAKQNTQKKPKKQKREPKKTEGVEKNSPKAKFVYDQDEKIKIIEERKKNPYERNRNQQTPYKNKGFDKKRQQNRSRIQQDGDFKTQRNMNEREQRRPRYNSQQKPYKRNQYSERRSQSNWGQSNKRQYSENNYQNRNRYEDKSERYEKKGDKYENKYNDKRNVRNNSQNRDPIERKFEKSGEVYRNPKIFQTFNEMDEVDDYKNSGSAANKRAYKDNASQSNQGKYLRQQYEQRSIPTENSGERRGRKVRR